MTHNSYKVAWNSKKKRYKKKSLFNFIIRKSYELAIRSLNDLTMKMYALECRIREENYYGNYTNKVVPRMI